MIIQVTRGTVRSQYFRGQKRSTVAQLFEILRKNVRASQGSWGWEKVWETHVEMDHQTFWEIRGLVFHKWQIWGQQMRCRRCLSPVPSTSPTARKNPRITEERAPIVYGVTREHLSICLQDCLKYTTVVAATASDAPRRRCHHAFIQYVCVCLS